MISGKQIFFPIDYFTCVAKAWTRHQRLYTPDDIHRLTEAAAREGNTDVFLWRVSACGSMTYWSNVESRISDNGDFRSFAKAVARTLTYFDPLAEGVKAAHAVGKPLYAWMTLFDEALFCSNSRILQQHPEFCWVDRSGYIHNKGLACYDYDEVFEFRLKIVRELLDYGVDGLYLSMRSHSGQVCPFKQPDMFGFNDPIVAEYKRRFGVNLRDIDDCLPVHHSPASVQEFIYKAPEFDVDAWHRLKGESLTRLLGAIRDIAGPEFPIWMCILGPYEGQDLDFHAARLDDLSEGLFPSARLHTDWHQWLDKGYVDGLVICPRDTLPPRSAVGPFQFAAGDLRKKLGWFSHLGGRRMPWEKVGELAQSVEDINYIHAILPYEAANFEILPEDK